MLPPKFGAKYDSRILNQDENMLNLKKAICFKYISNSNPVHFDRRSEHP